MWGIFFSCIFLCLFIKIGKIGKNIALYYYIALRKILLNEIFHSLICRMFVPFLDCLDVNRGQFTFDAEGNDVPTSKYFSRVPHVPTATSGITLGRGYDLKERKKKDVEEHLKDVGIDEKTAKKIAKGVKLKGRNATDFLKVRFIYACKIKK
jgi:hypothetical protein